MQKRILTEKAHLKVKKNNQDSKMSPQFLISAMKRMAVPQTEIR
jgi:hypothetical protein